MLDILWVTVTFNVSLVVVSSNIALVVIFTGQVGSVVKREIYPRIPGLKMISSRKKN